MRHCRHWAISFLFVCVFSIPCFSSVFPPVDEHGVRRIDPQAQAIIEAQIKKEPSTKSLYFNSKTHQYSAERLALHQKIINEVLHNIARIKEHKAIVIFTAGLPGSGKSTFLKNKLKDMSQYIHVDADEIRGKLPEYKGWNAGNTQDEVTDIIKSLFLQLEKLCQSNIIYDGTMASQKFVDTAIHFKHLKYKQYVIYIKIPVKIAKERAFKRYQQSGRYVPGQFIDQVSQKLGNTFTKIKPYLDGYIIIDGISGNVIEDKNFNPQ